MARNPLSFSLPTTACIELGLRLKDSAHRVRERGKRSRRVSNPWRSVTEEGIHYWFRTPKARATKDQWAYIHDLTFHDLRHGFAHRAREAGWSLEEVAY